MSKIIHKVRKYLGYIRISDPKQGKGVSLPEQKDAIIRYAQKNNLEVTEWYVERETAAKKGRPIFTQILKQLEQRKADGVIIHKIDRGARNLRDWSDLGDLIDQGVDVHFANEGLDLRSRGGRLSADIQAVVASDYIRNLREEAIKGFYGRIKQGIYPLPAPVGYLDQGAGEPKVLDPNKAPLVKKIFELYGSGKHGLEDLVEEMYRLGLRNRRGGKVTLSGIATILHSPFYIGLIRIRKTGELFPGKHKPLIPKSLFDRVQRILRGKTTCRVQQHDFLFRRLLTCKLCGYSLTGERQKGYVYYRCHGKRCLRPCIREEVVKAEVLRQFAPLKIDKQERAYLKQELGRLRANWGQERHAQESALSFRLNQVEERLQRLIDAYIDQSLEKEIFEERKSRLLMERKDLEEKLAQIRQENRSLPDRLTEFFELAGSLYSGYKMGFPEEKRDFLKIATSNREVDGKTPYFTLSFPFAEVANRHQNSNGGPYRGRLRTLDRMLAKLVEYFKSKDASLDEGATPF